MKIRSKITAIILAASMAIGIMPLTETTTKANEESSPMPVAESRTTTVKKIMPGAGQLSGKQKSNVYFGTYPQNQVTGAVVGETVTGATDGLDYSKDPIKWQVLANENNRLFLFSDKNLDVVEYYKTFSQSTTWEGSTIRKWLNGYEREYYDDGGFINKAFSEDEIKAIKETRDLNSGSAGENDTVDKIFLLSTDEVKEESYGFISDGSYNDPKRWGMNTEYVNNNNGKTEKNRLRIAQI